MSSNGHIKKSTVAVLLPPDKPTVLDAVITRLKKLQDYHFQTLNTLSQLTVNKDTHVSSCEDAIITICTPSALQLLAGFKNGGDYTRPLIILLSDGDVDPEFFDVADMILPLQSANLEQQLHALLRMRADNIAHQRERAQTLSKLQQLQAELRTQKRSSAELALLKDAIVQNVSHELKTPLLQVKSAVALLAEDVGKDHKLIGYAADATARLEALVKNITQLATGLDIHLTPVIINESVDQALRNLRRNWEHRDHVGRIKLKLSENLTAVLADRQGLGTVLQLLIDNALKFSEDDVEVIIEQREQQVYFAVRDHGIGIPKDQLETIFELFYQVDGSTTRRYNGTGVGLAIVKLILDKHHVTIQVESAEGQGSTFSFLLSAAKLK